MLQLDSKELYFLLFEVLNGKSGKINFYDRDLIERWIAAKVPLSEIIKAYGIMMKRCEKPSFRYMAKIIENSSSYWEGQKNYFSESEEAKRDFIAKRKENIDQSKIVEQFETLIRSLEDSEQIGITKIVIEKKAVEKKIEHLALDFEPTLTNDETLYLLSIPGMKEKLLEGMNTSISECIPEEKVKW